MARTDDRIGLYELKIEPNIELIRMWTRDGIPVSRICKALGISTQVLTKEARVHEPLWDALRVTKEIADLSLVDCLYKRATGYTAVTHQREYVYRYNADGSLRDRRLSKEKEIETHVPADPRLLEYWLSHRMPDEWGEREIVDENDGAGVVFLPPREDMPTAAAADGEAVKDDPDGDDSADHTGPGGVPGQNGEPRLYGAPVLHISPQNTEEPTGTDLKSPISTAN